MAAFQYLKVAYNKDGGTGFLASLVVTRQGVMVLHQGRVDLDCT